MARVDIDGAEDVARNLRKMADRYGKAVADAIYESGQMVRTSAIKSIQTTSPGQIVTRTREGGGTYQHTASVPGDAPNTDTGRLVDTIQVEVERGAVFVGSTLKYAGYLELGTRGMAARPWLTPALEGNRRKIIQRIKDATNRTSRRHGEV